MPGNEDQQNWNPYATAPNKDGLSYGDYVGNQYAAQQNWNPYASSPNKDGLSYGDYVGNQYAAQQAQQALQQVQTLRTMGRFEEAQALEANITASQQLVAQQNLAANTDMQVPGEASEAWRARMNIKNNVEMERTAEEGYARGGLVRGKSRKQAGGTDSLDLPESLSSLLPVGVDSSSYAPVTTGTVPSNPRAAAMDFRQQPTYAQGGQVGPGGAPMPPGGAPAGLAPQGQQGAAMDPKMLEMQLQKFMRENPQQVEQIKQAVMEAMQTGELTQEDLNMAVQLATVALQNPDAYPQVRQFAIQQGLADESELSMEYDQGLIFVLLLAAKAVQSETAGAVPGGNFSQGGEINRGTGPTSDDVSIRVSKGEFVIPADVVKAKGTDFFDKLINPKGGAGAA